MSALIHVLCSRGINESLRTPFWNFWISTFFSKEDRVTGQLHPHLVLYKCTEHCTKLIGEWITIKPLITLLQSLKLVHQGAPFCWHSLRFKSYMLQGRVSMDRFSSTSHRLRSREFKGIFTSDLKSWASDFLEDYLHGGLYFTPTEFFIAWGKNCEILIYMHVVRIFRWIWVQILCQIWPVWVWTYSKGMCRLRLLGTYWTHFTRVNRVQLRADCFSQYACIDGSYFLHASFEKAPCKFKMCHALLWDASR